MNSLILASSRMRKTHLLIALAIAGLLLLSGCAGRAVLTLSDLDPKFEFLEELGIQVVLIDYTTTGIDRYNEFFKSSALIYFTAELSQAMVNNAAANLKNYARDHLAAGIMEENIQELIGDTPSDQLTVEQSLAVMRMEKEQNRISDNESRYFFSMAGQLGIASLALIRGAKEAPDLIKKGKRLITHVWQDFTIMGIPRFWDIEPVVSGLDESLGRLKHVTVIAPVLIEDIVVLLQGFKELSATREIEVYE
ncbi:hypothetical protein ACFL45_08485 [Candidatus Neomarinimicrobiota bacterium]